MKTRTALLKEQGRTVLAAGGVEALLAQAKAANYCGQWIVLREHGTAPEELSRLYLAGGFANYIDVNNARDIGFIPNVPTSRISQVGNAALEGATIMLTSQQKRHDIEQLTRGIDHIQLETQTDFFDLFVEGCQFKPMKSNPTAD